MEQMAVQQVNRRLGEAVECTARREAADVQQTFRGGRKPRGGGACSEGTAA